VVRRRADQRGRPPQDRARERRAPVQARELSCPRE
jgi:hypothetical protein